MTARHSPRLEDLLPAYSLGALDGDELRELEDHVAGGCADCRRLLARWTADLEDLAASVPPVGPAASDRGRILVSVAEAAVAAPAIGDTPGRSAAAPAAERASTAGQDSARRGRGARSSWPASAWLPIAALLLLAIWGAWRQSSLDSQVRSLIAERDRQAARAEALEQRVRLVQAQAERMARTLSIVGSPAMQPVFLAGLAPAPGARGRTYVDASGGKAVFYAFDLPALAADKTYQLWFIDSGRPVSAGTFAVDARGKASLEVDNIASARRIQAWAVTIEPRGGVPQPTGAMVLKG
ncbi:MAG TPA: anti-sigma factor [Thermoanaerobaculia bacterium]|nr:anti-sigma factor [Thermoanaerobaculia bacterium]